MLACKFVSPQGFDKCSTHAHPNKTYVNQADHKATYLSVTTTSGSPYALQLLLLVKQPHSSVVAA